MPIRYRQYYLQKLVDILEKQQEEVDKTFKSKTTEKQPGKKPKEKPPIPDFALNTRAPKK